MRVSQQKQEMEITWKFSSWGSATKCHLCCPVRSSRGCRITPCCAQDTFVHQQSHCPGPQHRGERCKPPSWAPQARPEPDFHVLVPSPAGLRGCSAQRDLAEPGDTPGENLHRSLHSKHCKKQKRERFGLNPAGWISELAGFQNEILLKNSELDPTCKPTLSVGLRFNVWLPPHHISLCISSGISLRA